MGADAGRDHERLDPGRRVARGRAANAHEVLELLVLIRLVEARALQWTEAARMPTAVSPLMTASASGAYTASVASSTASNPFGYPASIRICRARAGSYGYAGAGP